MSKVNNKPMGKVSRPHSECRHSTALQPALGLCGCGGTLTLIECPDKNYMTTYYIQCPRLSCRLSVGRRYDPINDCNRGEFTDAQSAIAAANRAVGWKASAFNPPSNWCGEEAIK